MRRDSYLQMANVFKFRVSFVMPVLVCLTSIATAQPQAILLWPNGAPGSEGRPSEGKSPEETVRVNEYGEHIVSGVHHPSITPYLPAREKSTGAAVIIAPGGGHKELWMDHEGYNVASWLSDHGVAAFILKYRLTRKRIAGHQARDSPSKKPRLRMGTEPGRRRRHGLFRGRRTGRTRQHAVRHWRFKRSRPG